MISGIGYIRDMTTPVSKSSPFPLLVRALAAVILAAIAAVPSAAELAIRVGSGTEIVGHCPPPSVPLADDAPLALWLTGQHGEVEAERRAVDDLAARGVETCLIDLIAPYFLPLLPSSWARIPDADLVDWLNATRARHPRRPLVVIATGRNAATALRAARVWRAAGGDGVAGALLLFPLLYQELTPGAEPEYDAEVDHARLDLVILQPRSSAGFWWRERLQARLETAGARVGLIVQPGLRDGFYRRADINATELAAAARLGEIVGDGLAALIDLNATPRVASPDPKEHP